jgi:hypothetical protein
MVRVQVARVFLAIIMSETTTTTTDVTTSPSSVNGSSEPVSSLSDGIEQMRSFLSQDIPEDATDQDIAALLQHMDRVDSIGLDVEGKIDAVLGKLDSLLGTLQPDTSLQTVEAQGGPATPQRDGQ